MESMKENGEARVIPVRLGLSLELHDQLRLIAASNRCSMAEWVRDVVVDAIERARVKSPSRSSRGATRVKSRANAAGVK